MSKMKDKVIEDGEMQAQIEGTDVPANIHVISNLKNLPVTPMIEYNQFHGFTPSDAQKKFFIETGTFPTEMYCLIHWYIPIDLAKVKKIEDKVDKKDKVDKDDKKK